MNLPPLLMSNNQQQTMPKLTTNYQQQKMNFLDSLKPDDLRNGDCRKYQ